jgi:nicotinate phosphoribosyltransferase
VGYDGRPVLKLSSKKQTLPGAKQVFRYCDAERMFLRDLASADESVNGAEALLGEVMRDGKRLRPSLAREELRQRFRREFTCLPQWHKALKSPEPYEVVISEELQNLQRRVVEEVERRELNLR